MRRPRLVPALVGLLLASPALADWETPGVIVARPQPPIILINETKLIPAPDASVIALGSGSTASTEYWGSQRATPTGQLTLSWPGLLTTIGTVATANGPGLLAKIGLAFSTSGDLLTSWADGVGSSFVHHQRLLAYNSPAPTLVDRSFTVSFSWSPQFTALVPASGDEAYVFYGASSGTGAARLSRRTAAGGVSSGWPVNGKRVFLAPAADGALLPDGAGGVIASERNTSFEFRVNRVNADTTFGAGWTSAGLLLSNNVDFSTYQSFPQLLPSGPGAYLACWSEFEPATTPPTREISLRRFLANGTLDPAWTQPTQLVFQSSTAPRFSVLSDGSGGAFVLFEVEGEPRGTHILSTGVVDPAIGADDAPLLDPAAQYIGDRAPARVPLVAAPGKNGGLIFVWTDGRDAPQGALRARWLTSSLQPDPTEPATPRMIPTANADYADVRAANSDGAGGLYVAWGDYPASDPNGVVMMNRVLASEFLSAPPSGRPSTLALSAPRPNPAHGAVALDVTLPDDSPARVELLDVAGRVVRSQTLQGAGVHSVSFDALGGVPPGLYFARVTARSGAQGTRLVVSR